MKPLLLAVLIFSCASATSQTKTPIQPKKKVATTTTLVTPKPKPTLGNLRSKFLNQEVDIVGESVYDCHAATKGEDGIYRRKSGEISGYNCKGLSGTVVDVRLSDNPVIQHVKIGDKNAFGESIGEANIENPYVDLTVGFKDGSFALITDSAITLESEVLQLSQEKQANEKEIQAKLPSIVGQKLFTFGRSRLYKPNATIQEMKEDWVLARIIGLHSLEPLIITKAVFVHEEDAVLLKVTMSDGAEAIAYTPNVAHTLHVHQSDFLDVVSGNLLTSFPKGLTAREIQAIKTRVLFRGMSGDAVTLAYGYAESENDWGRGGTQRVYYSGKLLIYLNTADKVEDWQELE